jgi:DNA-binding CsgD family transcriptional regulator
VALDHCATTPGEARTGLRIAIRLDDYWGILGLHTEARHWLDGALAAAPEPTAERVSALRMSGWFALLQGDEEQGRRLLDAAAALAEETGDRPEAAYVQHAYGMAALFSGDLDTAQVLMDRALQGFRHAKVLRGELFSLFIGALAHGGNGQPQRGLAMIDECLELSNRHQEVFWRSYALWGLAYLIVITTGDYDRAAAAAQEAVRYKRQLYDHLGLAFAVDTLAWVAERRGQHKRAAVLFGVAHTIWEGLGASPANYPVFAELHDKHARLTRSTLGDAAYEAAFQDGAAMSSEVALDYALEEGTADGPEPAAPAPPRAVGSLTRREREIAELIARGMTNREIAQTLVIAVRTAEGHVEHILSKLGFSSRAQVAAWVTGQRLRDRAPAT